MPVGAGLGHHPSPHQQVEGPVSVVVAVVVDRENLRWRWIRTQKGEERPGEHSPTDYPSAAAAISAAHSHYGPGLIVIVG